MADATQAILTASIPTLAVFIGILVNNSRLGDVNNRVGDLNNRVGDLNTRLIEIRSDMNRRFDDVNRRIEDTRDLLRAEFFRVEQVLDARLKHIEEDR
jgi:hypothetical protein